MGQDTTKLLVFILVLATMALAEAIWPRRARSLDRTRRWFSNLSLSVINSIVMKLLGPIAALGVANYALDNNIGLIAQLPMALPVWLEVAIGFLILDLAIYVQHVYSHKIPILWRIHKVHHADRDIDVTTGIRFHPLEAALSMLYKCGLILALGTLPLTVFIFELVLNASAMFHHANLKIAGPIDRVLRLVIVTPDMHRVHHSTILAETNSNYGFFLPTWDRLFKTYKPQPKLGHTAMNIGLEEHQSESPALLAWSLLLPVNNK